METKKFNLNGIIAEAMNRINRHIEANANSLESSYASEAHNRLTNDRLFGGPYGLNRSRAAVLADLAILGWL